MNQPTILQAFLLFDVFLIGALCAVAISHAYAHFHPTEIPQPDKPAHIPPPATHLPTTVRDHLIATAQANFETVLERATKQLTKDLDATEVRLARQLKHVSSDIADQEMERYHAELEHLREEATSASDNAQTELADHQADLKAKLEQEITAERERLLTQLDTRLGDAVASFLVDTLQHNVDLGAQSAYLMSALEEHKAELAQEIRNETRVTK